jgi:hypothetical protein
MGLFLNLPFNRDFWIIQYRILQILLLIGTDISKKVLKVEAVFFSRTFMYQYAWGHILQDHNRNTSRSTSNVCLK